MGSHGTDAAVVHHVGQASEHDVFPVIRVGDGNHTAERPTFYLRCRSVGNVHCVGELIGTAFCELDQGLVGILINLPQVGAVKGASCRLAYRQVLADTDFDSFVGRSWSVSVMVAVLSYLVHLPATPEIVRL